MALKDEWSPKYAFPGAGTSLLKSPRKSLLYVSRCWLLGAAAAAGAADPSKRRLPARKPHATEGRQRLLLLLCPQRHGPPGRGNTMTLKDERSPKYAFPEAGTSLLKSPRKSLLYVSRCWLLGAAAAAAVPTKTRPSRTGKHHGPEGRMESKICVSRGRNVPSEIS